MLIYLYDGSFEGLLNAIAAAMERRQKPDRISNNSKEEEGLFLEKVRIKTDSRQAALFLEKIKQKFPYKVLQNALLLFLSEMEDFELVVFDYLNLIFQYGAQIFNNLSNESILKAHRMCQKVILETHRLKGLIRFKELKDGFLYAPIEPDHNVLQLIAPHFTRRLASQKWMIHDLKRGIGAFYQNGKWKALEIEGKNILLSEEENGYQELWKTYFETIAIAERKNPALQKRFMPKRYWKYLVEKSL
jgi:probable DNA metabolism protein